MLRLIADRFDGVWWVRDTDERAGRLKYRDVDGDPIRRTFVCERRYVGLLRVHQVLSRELGCRPIRSKRYHWEVELSCHLENKEMLIVNADGVIISGRRQERDDDSRARGVWNLVQTRGLTKCPIQQEERKREIPWP